MRQFFYSLLAFFVFASASAAGYRIEFMGIRQAALGHTGAMHTHDASVAFFNPAGLAFVEDNLNIAFGASGLTGEALARNNTQQVQNDPTAGPPSYLAASINLGRRVSLGFHAGAAYAEAGSFDKDSGFPGRFNGLGSSSQYIHVQPTIAVKLSDYLSVGYGYSHFLENEEFTSQTYTSLWDQIQANVNANPFGFAIGNIAGYIDVPASALVDLEGTSAAQQGQHKFGLFLNLMGGKLKIGGSYRTSVEVVEQGTMSLSEIPNAFGGTNGAFYSNPINQILFFPGYLYYLTVRGIFQGNLNDQLPTSAKFTTNGKVFPAEYSVGASIQLSPQIMLSGEVRHTKWSDYQVYNLVADNPTIGTQGFDINWKDIYGFSLGTEWTPHPNVALRFGFQYEDDPSDPEVRTVLNRAHYLYRFTTGAGVKVKNFDLNLYAGFSYGKPTVINTDNITSNGALTLGTGKATINYRDVGFGFGLTYHWFKRGDNRGRPRY